jgi:MinD-like ATPase involved in chromosome partitioning or flagellar assembly
VTTAGRSERGTVWTFYSYKGGVGRTFALANISTLVARWGYGTLCVDWDLEAPGLHEYYKRYLPPSRPGVVELVEAFAAGAEVSWREHVTPLDVEGSRLDLLPAGRFDDSFARRMQDLEWGRLYADRELGLFVERMRDEWKLEYDLVLVDSRTGLTDIGGLCTVQLPDFLAVFFTPNTQSIDGALNVARIAAKQRDALPVDRAQLPVLPVVTRFEASTEVALAQHWLGVIEKSIEDVVSIWRARSVYTRDVLTQVRVPYVPHWSFGERLPVLEARGGDERSTYGGVRLRDARRAGRASARGIGTARHESPGVRGCSDSRRKAR